jgi:hypothetical protein
MLTGLNQKVRGQVQGPQRSPAADDAPPAQRHDLTRRGIDAEHGKPVVLPPGKRAARRADGTAGNGSGRKPTPVCNRPDRVATSPSAKAGRLPRGEDARERSANRLQAVSQICRPDRNGRRWCGCRHRVTSGAGSEVVSCRCAPANGVRRVPRGALFQA